MNNQLIYIAEDEKNIRILIETFLMKEGFNVRSFETGDDLFDEFEIQRPDLVILDVMMPGSSGFIICSKIRSFSTVPIIFLTARDSDEDFISGISLGSDAYFTKPFSPIKLVMQVKAMLRRVEMDTTRESNENLDEFKFYDLILNSGKMSVTCKSTELKLTQIEYSFLSYLIESNGHAVSREKLLAKVWGYDKIVETRATDDTVKRLRKKLIESNSRVQIETIRGFGFKLTGEVS